MISIFFKYLLIGNFLDQYAAIFKEKQIQDLIIIQKTLENSVLSKKKEKITEEEFEKHRLYIFYRGNAS